MIAATTTATAAIPTPAPTAAAAAAPTHAKLHPDPTKPFTDFALGAVLLQANSDGKSLFVSRLAQYSLVQAIPKSDWLTQSSLLNSVVSRVDGLACSGLDLAESTGTKALQYSDPYVKVVSDMISTKADTTLTYLEKSVDSYLPPSSAPVEGETPTVDKPQKPTTMVGRVSSLSRTVVGGSWAKFTTARTTFITHMANREKELLAYSADHLSSVQKLTHEKTSAVVGYASFFYNKAQSVVSGTVGIVRQQVGSVHSFGDAKEKLMVLSTEAYARSSSHLSSLLEQVRSYASQFVPILKSKVE